jgi:hypothetical protein
MYKQVWLPLGGRITPTWRYRNSAGATSRNEEDLLRVGIFDLAARLIARHIDVSAVWVVRTENVPRFPGNRLRYWELRGAI